MKAKLPLLLLFVFLFSQSALAQKTAAAHSPATGHSDSSNPLTEDLAENDQLVPSEFAAPAAGAPGAASAPGSARPCSEPTAPSDDEFLREREVESTSEGMPSGELDEEPKADSASAGE